MKKSFKVLLTAGCFLVLGLLISVFAFAVPPWPETRDTTLLTGMALVALVITVGFSVLLLLLVRMLEIKSRDLTRTEEVPPVVAQIPTDQFVTREQIVDLIMKHTPEPSFAELIREGDTDYAMIDLGENDTLKLAVEKDGAAYVLKREKPIMTQAHVLIEKEGMDTNKLILTESNSGLLVEYNPDSIWAYLDLSFPSMTAEGAKDERLSLFFNYDELPPAPMAFDLAVVRKARLERRGSDFYLAEKGYAVVKD